MPEKAGVITWLGKDKTTGQPSGIQLDDVNQWYNPTKVGQDEGSDWPNVVKGDRVLLGYSEEYGRWCFHSVIKADPSAPSAPSELPTVETGAPSPGSELWAKDRLRARTDCIACATGIYKSCIEAGLVKELPSSETLIAYAESLEKWARE
jgi:hypothetical protein